MIHWAHTSEMADPYPYLLGGELLLTAGVHVPEAAGSGTYFDDYVSRIVEAGGAALGFGVAPVHDTVPRALVVACDDYGLPLVEVPPRTTFSGVARAVWQLMAQARHTELRRVTEAQQSLAAAAARPDPVPSVLRQLAQRVGGRAALYAPDGGEVASAGRMPAAGAGTGARGEVSGALAGLVAVVRPATRNGSGAGTGDVVRVQVRVRVRVRVRARVAGVPRPPPRVTPPPGSTSRRTPSAPGRASCWAWPPRAAIPATTRSRPWARYSSPPHRRAPEQHGCGALLGPRTATAGSRAGGGRAAAGRG